MKKIVFILLVIVTATTHAQLSVTELVNQGIKYHDAGEYDKAIETYKKALEIDKESTLANYEIAFTYFSKQAYNNAIQHADKVIEKNGDNLVEAYLIKGSALDMQGKTQESIALYKTAIEKTWGHYLFYYNIALDYYKIADYNNAEKYVTEALNTNFEHGSSHLLLADINNKKGKKTETVLGATYFILIEHDSNRSKQAYTMLMKILEGDVKKDETTNQLNVDITMPDEDNADAFSNTELVMGIMAANNYIEKEKGKTDFEILTTTLTSYFTMLSELDATGKENIYFTKYIPFFTEIVKSKHMEAFCAYIASVGNVEAAQWIDNNQEKLLAFGKWISGEEEE